MDKTIFFILLIIVSINSFGQNYFDKGYFIDNNNIKTDCFIKNTDPLKNPSKFYYKLSESGEVLEESSTNVKEFSIPNSFKYIRADVNIDISPSVLKDLTTDKNPIWQRKQLPLRVLVEGKANLYYYLGTEFDERFFYSCNDSIISQLIHKEYIYNVDHTAFNDTFRLQLQQNVRCSFASDIALSDLAYKKKPLIKYFVDYNTCIDSTYKVPEKKQNKGKFSLALSAGLAYSSLSISNIYTSYADANFGKKVNPTCSFEVEYILPINNNKWAIGFGPTYQSYHAKKQTIQGDVSVDFESIDFALGFKHYFFLNNKAKLYIGGYYNLLAFHCINSTIGYKADRDNYFSYFDIKMYKPNYIISTGFEYQRIFADLRYYTDQDLLSSYFAWHSNFEKMTFSIGYKILSAKRDRH